MKKDLIFTPILLAIGASLFLLGVTGMYFHIAISVVGVLLLVAYAVLTKKQWKLPALEILMRVCYGISLISGIVMMNVHGIKALAIAHKVGAVLYVVLLAVLFIVKLTAKKSK